MCTVGCALAYALSTQPLLGLLLLAAVPTTLLLAAWQARVQKGARLAVLRAEEALGGTLVEQFGDIEYCAAANAHDREVERVARVAEEQHRQEVRRHFRGVLFEALKGLDDWALQIAVITGAVLLTASGKAEAGTTLTFWVLLLQHHQAAAGR